ncbi:MAG: T9SS type A sorting domain-containing protein [Flavobacterium sp.]|nr:T9SS type A sorting domain-containing protein [Flavobacterium sp.]
MKKITLLITLLSFSFGFAQQVVVQNFETPSSFTFVGFEGLASASIEMDPEVGGTRMNNLRLVSQSGGNPWQGAEVLQQNTLIKLTTDKTVQIDVYATQAFTLLAKVEVGGPNSAASQNYTTPNAWQTLTFTFTQGLDGTTTADGNYQKIVFFPNWNPTNAGFLPPGNFTVYVDNITSEATPILPPAEPATAAPTPPARPVDDVRSIFSDAYAPISVIGYTGEDNTYNNSWCGANTTLVQIQGNNTHKVTGLGCEGVTFLAGRFDATTFTHFHMDIWTETATLDKSFNVKFSNWNGGAGEANAIEFSVNNSNFLTNPNPGTWISLDIPLANFAPIVNANRNDIVQFVITSDLGTVFYDNLYLHKNTVLSVSSFEKSNIKMYPNPATTNFTIEAQDNIEKIAVLNMLGQEVISKPLNNQQATIDISSLQVGVYVVKATFNGIVSTSRIVKE